MIRQLPPASEGVTEPEYWWELLKFCVRMMSTLLPLNVT